MPAIPTRLFDVRQGDNAIDADTTAYPNATFIVYKDAASKNKVIDAFAEMGSYSATIPNPAIPGATIPNPQNKRQFFNKELQSFINDRVKASRDQVQRKAAAVIDNTDLP